MTTTTTADWVQQAISKLLTDSHIHFPSLPGISLGPGPIDVFSTDFSKTFTSNVTAVVDGKSEDFDGLKNKFLALRQHYDPQNSKFVQLDSDSSPGVNGSIVKLLLQGVSKDLGPYDLFILTGVVVIDGENKIADIDMKGPAGLFKQ